VQDLRRVEQVGNRAAVTVGNREQPFTHSVAITRTACGFGGHRVWFVCPACCARAGTLFAVGRILACRSCHGLAYRSQSFGAMASAFACMFRHMGKLGPGFTKPKGMHHSTYLHLLTSAHAALMPASLLVDSHMQNVWSQLHELGITVDEGLGLAKLPTDCLQAAPMPQSKKPPLGWLSELSD